jgi:hypothetical protein
MSKFNANRGKSLYSLHTIERIYPLFALKEQFLTMGTELRSIFLSHWFAQQFKSYHAHPKTPRK